MKKREEAVPIVVDDELAVVRKLLGRYFSDHPSRDAHSIKIDAIAARVADPRLHVALVGEFSSGKSTFINALLRRPLLAASCVATTTTITRVNAGRELSVTVRFRGGKTVAATEKDCSALRDELRRLCKTVTIESPLQMLLDLLSADEEIAGVVERLDVVAPSPRLSDDVVIIDTPGINAGHRGGARQLALTRAALSESIDATIVLIPSRSAMSKTLLSFLESDAKRFLQRAIFVVTGMDEHSAEDRREIIALIHDELVRTTGVAQPTVFESAPISIVPSRSGDTPECRDRAEWQKRFETLETFVMGTMRRQRNVIIAERLVDLLDDLMTTMGKELAEIQIELDAEQALLRKDAVGAVEQVMASICEAANNELELLHTNAATAIAARRASFAQTAKRSAHAAIAGATADSGDFERRVRPAIVDAVERTGRDYTAAAGAHWEETAKLARRLGNKLRTQFEKNYSTFPALEVAITSPTVAAVKVPSPDIRFTSTASYLDDQNQRKRVGTRLGAAAGAATALMLGLGPIGWLALGVAAATGVRQMSGDDDATRAATLRKQIDSEIDAYFEQAETSLCKSLHRVILRAMRELADAAGEHVREYGAAVAEIIRGHEEKKLRLGQRIASLINDSRDLKSRRERLHELREQLSQC